MTIKITEAVRDAVGMKSLSKYGVKNEDFRWNGGASLNIRTFKPDQIQALIDLLSPHKAVRSVPTLVSDLKFWQTVKGGSKHSVKLKSVKFLADMLRSYIGAVSTKHVYFRLANSDNYLCYYVNKIIFHPKSTGYGGGTIPAHVTMECVYEDFKERSGHTWTWYDEDVQGKTVIDVLATFGLFRQTDELRASYELERDRCFLITGQVGKQFLAYGTATNDMDGNPRSRDDSWYWTSTKVIQMERDGQPTKCVIDIFKEEEKQREGRVYVDTYFWTRWSDHSEDEESDDPIDDLNEASEPEIPIHAWCAIFDLSKHLRLKTHVNNLIEYQYDADIADKLVLPVEQKRLVRMLIEHKSGSFRDIIAGKSGGAIVLLTGKPGVGKTLTAEIYAENEGRALYSIQCSQLGTDPSELEDELLKVFTRAARWNAVMLLDEADVYIRQRGADLQQNAIVGVFLRVLEYQSSVMFLTTNRPQDVDDAIASRCIARLSYEIPNPQMQEQIWGILAEGSGVDLPQDTIREIGLKSPDLSGRDIKNLLKLGMLVSSVEGKPIGSDMIEYVKQFKPTN